MHQQLQDDLLMVQEEVKELSDAELTAVCEAFGKALLICEEELVRRGDKPAPQVLGAVSVQSAEGFGQG